ncbi:MAG: type II toxin-antitoxin system PemK/MazF family toxin [Methanoregula sp.]|jgi:mRNA-degrading endonuclease toxin of MazEF toxin-antitoxin module|nr:type II toxin-antitoxin system PemK/MazF family toxin [Methanoregula sp.]
MGQYLRGDVLLAPVALDNRSVPKTRPVVVISTCSDGRIRVSPVTSKPPTDASSLPLTIDDFESGGLDLFSESYIMTSRIITLRSGEIIGKKGRLTPDSLAEVAARVPDTIHSGTQAKPKKSRTPRR